MFKKSFVAFAFTLRTGGILALRIFRERRRLQNCSNNGTTTPHECLLRCEAALYGCGTNPVCLFYAITTLFHLYHGGDKMHEMRRRKPEHSLLPTQGIFNLPHHIGIVREELAFDDAVSYTQWWISKLAEVMAWGL